MARLDEMRLWFAGADEGTWGYPVQYVDVEIAIHAGISLEAPFGTKLWYTTLNSSRWSDSLTQETFFPEVEVGSDFTIVITPVKPTANGPSPWGFDWFLLTLRRGTAHDSIDYGYSLDGPEFYTPNASFRVYLLFDDSSIIQTSAVGGQPSHVLSYQDSTNNYTAQTNFAGILLPLDAPYDLFPVHNAEDVSPFLEKLEWECDGEPDEYRITLDEYDLDWNLIKSILSNESVQTKFYNLDGVLSGSRIYSWKVRAVYSDDGIDTSFHTFTTKSVAPHTPTPTDEAEDVDVEIESLEWECDGEPDEYRVYLAEQGEDLIHVGTTTEKEFSLEQVPPQYLKMETTYEWTVSAVYDGTEVFPEGHEE